MTMYVFSMLKYFEQGLLLYVQNVTKNKSSNNFALNIINIASPLVLFELRRKQPCEC